MWALIITVLAEVLGPRFELVGRHLAILVHEVRRLEEVAVVVAERGERRLDRLATLVEAVVQVAAAAGRRVESRDIP